jgi:hypothetical protein
MANNTDNKRQRLPFIPKEIHSQLKVTCAAKGISMQEASEEAILDWIKKNTLDNSQ